MMKLLIRADDLGFSEAVNYGIRKALTGGLVKSVGLMPNMAAAEHGVELVSRFDVSLGQHTNVCVGKPCANPSLIPSLLDENGSLKSSKAYREAYIKGEEIAETDELVIEIEAQYQRFRELTGREPAYFEAHAVLSRNLQTALEIVSAEHGLKLNRISLTGDIWRFSSTDTKVWGLMDSVKPDYDPKKSLRNLLNCCDGSVVNMFVCHPGYLDAYILNHSSMTVSRTKEVEMLCDPEVCHWITGSGAELVSYDDLD